MDEIINLTEEDVVVGHSDGTLTTFPVVAINYPNPQVGDQVKLFTTDGKSIISKVNSPVANQPIGTPINTLSSGPSMNVNAKVVNVNKHLFVWLGAFLFGVFGVDRFMRGQIGVGICKLLFGWLTLGLWATIDWIIALVKAYSTFNDTEDLTFINGKYAR
jgi:TM2 domain-containing membrane protein YozV